MPKRKSAQNRLSDMRGKNAVKPMSLPDVPEFIRKMTYFHDPDEAVEIVRDQAGLVFDQTVDGMLLARLTLEKEDIEVRYGMSEKRTLAGWWHSSL